MIWVYIWETFLFVDRLLNILAYWIPMPGGHRLGSGKYETLCRHWHRLHRRHNCLWAADFCFLLSFVDCDHCKKAAEGYEEEC